MQTTADYIISEMIMFIVKAQTFLFTVCLAYSIFSFFSLKKNPTHLWENTPTQMSTFQRVIDRFHYILLIFQTVDFISHLSYQNRSGSRKSYVKLNLFSHNCFGLVLCYLVNRRSLNGHQPQVSCREPGRVEVGLHV